MYRGKGVAISTVGYLCLAVTGWMISMTDASWFSRQNGMALLSPVIIVLGVMGILSFVQGRALDAIVFFGGTALLGSASAYNASLGLTKVADPYSYLGWFAICGRSFSSMYGWDRSRADRPDAVSAGHVADAAVAGPRRMDRGAGLGNSGRLHRSRDLDPGWDHVSQRDYSLRRGRQSQLAQRGSPACNRGRLIVRRGHSHSGCLQRLKIWSNRGSSRACLIESSPSSEEFTPAAVAVNASDPGEKHRFREKSLEIARRVTTLRQLDPAGPFEEHSGESCVTHEDSV